MFTTLEAVAWGAILRMAETLIEASPTLLCGLIVAGVFRCMLGPRRTLRLFGGNGWTGLPRAWLLGMLLPVCSLGMFPILKEMRRSRIAGGTILAFALAAPLFNPISFLYGLTLSQPFVIFCFMFLSLVVVTIIGVLWDRCLPANALEAGEVVPGAVPGVAPDVAQLSGGKRLLAVAGAAARDSCGKATLGYFAVACGGVALLSCVLPAGILQQTMSHRDPWSPALMAAVALPAYDSPIKAMMQLGLIFEHGNSVGAALTLLILGAGANLGTIAWMTREYGWRASLAGIGLMVGSVLSLAYLCETPLYTALREEPHTHAFDDFSAPFSHGVRLDFPSAVRAKLADAIDLHETVSLGALALLIVAGAGLKIRDRRGWFPARVDVPPASVPAGRSVWNRPLPAPVLGGAVLAGLVLFSVRACYLYYPQADELFEEIRLVRASALTEVLTGNAERAIRDIRRWDDLTRKLEVGVYLRSGRVAESAHVAAEELRESLEQIRDALLAGNKQQARELLPVAQKQHEECRRQFLTSDAAS